MTEIKKSNKLIAEFMGKYFMVGVISPIALCSMGNVEELKFHNSWDWLIPVLQKILDIAFSDDESEISDSEHFYGIRDCIPDINHTYNAVVEFINLYNENKEK